MLSNPWKDKGDMSELTFAKSFLSSLDSKPQKLPADHVYDLKTFSPRIPVRRFLSLHIPHYLYAHLFVFAHSSPP